MQKVTEIAHTYINMLISENVNNKGGESLKLHLSLWSLLGK